MLRNSEIEWLWGKILLWKNKNEIIWGEKQQDRVSNFSLWREFLCFISSFHKLKFLQNCSYFLSEIKIRSDFWEKKDFEVVKTTSENAIILNWENPGTELDIRILFNIFLLNLISFSVSEEIESWGKEIFLKL